MVVVILDIFVLSKKGKKSSRSADRLVTDVKRPGREEEGGGHSLFRPKQVYSTNRV